MTNRDLQELREQAVEDGPIGRIARGILKLRRCILKERQEAAAKAQLAAPSKTTKKEAR